MDGDHYEQEVAITMDDEPEDTDNGTNRRRASHTPRILCNKSYYLRP